MKHLTLGSCILALSAGVALASAPAARAEGFLGNSDMSVGGSLLYGERLGGGGFGFVAQLEIATAFERTALGNWMGIEFFMDLGYESYDGEDPYGGSNTMGPLIFDMAVGFPLTILKLGDGGPGSTLVSIALGAGFGAQHAYGYLRGRILMTMGESSFLEVMGRWTPSEASNDWTDKTGLDVYQLRLSYMFDASEDFDLRIFVDWTPADRTRIGRRTDPNAFAEWPPETTTAFQSVFSAGVGFMF